MCVLVCVYDMCVSVGLVMTHYSCRDQRAAWVVGMPGVHSTCSSLLNYLVGPMKWFFSLM